MNAPPQRIISCPQDHDVEPFAQKNTAVSGPVPRTCTRAAAARALPLDVDVNPRPEHAAICSARGVRGARGSPLRVVRCMDAAIDLRIGLQLSPARDLRVRQPRLGGHQDCYGECGGYARGPPSAFSGRMWVSPLGATPRGVPVPGCARAREASALRGRRDVASAGLCGEVCVSYAKICDPWHPAPLLCSPGSLLPHRVRFGLVGV